MLYLKDIYRGEWCEPLTQCQLCVCVHAVFVCHRPALHPLLFQIILPNVDMHAMCIFMLRVRGLIFQEN